MIILGFLVLVLLNNNILIVILIYIGIVHKEESVTNYFYLKYMS